jgi:hypothetical protein
MALARREDVLARTPAVHREKDASGTQREEPLSTAVGRGEVD